MWGQEEIILPNNCPPFSENIKTALHNALTLGHESASLQSHTLGSKEAAFLTSSSSTPFLMSAGMFLASKVWISSFTPLLARKLSMHNEHPCVYLLTFFFYFLLRRNRGWVGVGWGGGGGSILCTYRGPQEMTHHGNKYQ